MNAMQFCRIVMSHTCAKCPHTTSLAVTCELCHNVTIREEGRPFIDISPSFKVLQDTIEAFFSEENILDNNFAV